jgi:hypothetical protein
MVKSESHKTGMQKRPEDNWELEESGKGNLGEGLIKTYAWS